MKQVIVTIPFPIREIRARADGVTTGLIDLTKSNTFAVGLFLIFILPTLDILDYALRPFGRQIGLVSSKNKTREAFRE